MESERSAAFRLLGIPPDSEQEVVVRAFRRLARATHPDVSTDPDASRRFDALTAAYRLASEPADRRAASVPAPPMVVPGAWRRPPVMAGPVRFVPHPRTGGRRFHG